MSEYALTLNNTDLRARADGALWWPARRLLCVSDLHLGKSERIARRGGTLLPPYETRETLWRLEAAISATSPQTVICLGDSFDDLSAARTATDETRATLTRLQAGRDWVWIEGNHDPGPIDLGGTHRCTQDFDTLVFRHIATPRKDGDHRGEISGHYHPKATLTGIGRRACFVFDKTNLIMPAFGAYTGGLSVRDVAIEQIIDRDAIAVLTGKKAIAVPITACLSR